MADAVVLCYHALSERWPADLSVTPQAFADQLAHMHRRGYRGVTFGELVQRPSPSRGKRVAVTFDDAFTSVSAHAKPVLDALGWPATVFAVSTFAANGQPLLWDGIDHWAGTEHAHELEGMTWPALRALAEQGWEIGSHTATHPHLTAIDDAAVASELTASRAAIEQALGRPCRTLAYPYGDVDPRVRAATAAAGYSAAAALPARWTSTADALGHPRVGVYHPDDMLRFRAKVSPLVRAARRLARR